MKINNYIDLSAYQLARKLSDIVWDIVISWDWFAKSSLGIQWIRAVDSIGANIAEGFGRFHKKDKIKFYYNSRASVLESMHWRDLSYRRKLINDEKKRDIDIIINQLPKSINTLIKITALNLKK